MVAFLFLASMDNLGVERKGVDMDDFDVGDFGEDTFTAIATSSGITSTPARKDRFGWDSLLEFKNPSSSVFWDSYESYYSVNVQVKGFECDYEKYNGRDIRLSNILHMINSNNPQFFAFVSVKYNLVYLVHLNNELITSGLKRIREEQAKNENVKLNKKYLRVNPHQHDVMIVRHGELKDALIKVIGSSPSEYTKNKQILVKNVGYESERLSMEGQINPQELLDVELGLKDSTFLDMVNMKDIRFGIPIELKEQPISVEILGDNYVDENFSNSSQIVKGKTVELELKPLDGGIPMIVEATLRVSILSKEYKKFVLESNFFKMIFEDKHLTVNLRLNSMWKREEEISNIIHAIKVAEIIFSESGVDFSIYNDKLIFRRKTMFIEDDALDYSQYLLLAKSLKCLFEILDVNKKIKLSNYIPDIDGYINTMRFISSPDGNTKYVKVCNLGEFRVSEENVKVIVPISIIVEGEHYILISSTTGKVEDTGHTSSEPQCCIIKVHSQELVYKTKARGINTKDEVKTRIKSISEDTPSDCQVLVIGDAYNPELL